MSDITDWEPEMITHNEINWEEHYERQLNINEKLILENEKLKTQTQEYKETSAQSRIDSLLRDSKELTAKFTCFKAEAVTILKAIDMCILASLNTEKQYLTHRARNFRMRHVHQIICNQIDVFCDRKLTTYEDDF